MRRLLILAVLLIASCGGPATTPTARPTPAATDILSKVLAYGDDGNGYATKCSEWASQTSAQQSDLAGKLLADIRALDVAGAPPPSAVQVEQFRGILTAHCGHDCADPDKWCDKDFMRVVAANMYIIEHDRFKP